MTLSSAALADVAGQECGEPWLELLEVTHPDMVAPLRVVNDHAAITSGGEIYRPAAFSLTLPDSAQGQQPRAELVLDNITQELAAIFRALTSPPVITIRIVRASAPDVIEAEWAGLQLRGAQITAQSVVCRLEVAPIEREPFPPMRFDRRWPGIFSS